MTRRKGGILPSNLSIIILTMPRILLLVLLTACFALPSTAQNITAGIRGTVTDSAAKQSMAGATISLTDLSDSSSAGYTLATAKGNFEFKLDKGKYQVVITFQGFQPYVKTFSLTAEKPVMDFGNVILKEKNELLAEVIVVQPPIKVNKDTVEYNAGSFKTKPNAVVEDLLKKLPGVQVDKSGTITAQGETVTRVLVDGKRFFGDDPKLATKNLPPDIVDKIQVFDDLSDQSKFTGFDDGNRVKTINITTKKDKRKGYFGKVAAGVGNEQTYDNSVNLHRFNGDQQISLIGQANDINKQNFSVQDFLGGGGRGGGGRGGGGGGSSSSGITTSWAGGMNYHDNWGKNAEGYGSYFFNSQHVSTGSQSSTQNLKGSDGSTFTDQDSHSIRRNQNHRINFNIDEKLDSANSIIFRPNIGFQHTTTSSTQSSIYSDQNKSTIYTTNGNSAQENHGINGGFDLLYRHKFSKRYRTYSLDLNLNRSTNDGNGENFSLNHHFLPVDTTNLINQQSISSSSGTSISPTFSYTEPLGKNQILEMNYNYSYSKNLSDRDSYAYDSATAAYDRFDSLYSNSFQNTNKSNRLTLSYRLQNQRFNFSAGSGIQKSSLRSINSTKRTDISQDFTNFTPTVNFQYNFTGTNKQNLRFNYNGRTGQPSISQLQPIQTTSDSINFNVGNPGLKQQFTHSLRMLYSNFNVATQRVIFVTVNASMISNDIQNWITYTPNNGTITMPVNLNGTYNLNGYFNYGFALKKPKSNLNLTSNIGYSQSQTLVTNEYDNKPSVTRSAYARNTTLGETISWTTNLKDNFDMNFSSTTTYVIARNTLQPLSNLNYYTQSLSAEITYFSTSGWIVATDFDYTYNGNRGPGYNASIPLLTPSIAKQIFKNKQGEIRLSVFDLLNQNVSVTHSVSTNTISDTKSTVLTRYGLLTFTYNLRRFGGKGQRMPGMFRNMRNMMRDNGIPGGDGGFPGGGGGGGGRRGGGGRGGE